MASTARFLHTAVLVLATLGVSACAMGGPTPQVAVAPAGPASGPVRNLPHLEGAEIVTIRYWKIRKGGFPQFLEASKRDVWPFFEKMGARIVGMWRVIPDPEGEGVSPDYDEVYLMTRYASLEHWSATRDGARLGGDGPDFEAMQRGLAVRRNLTIETRVTYMQGETGPFGPYYLPPTGETFERVE
jgi:hypothetical protein